MSDYSYYEKNKPEALAKKGELFDFTLCSSEASAQSVASDARRRGRRARTCRREIKVDGIEILVFVVVIRKAAAKAVAA